MESSEYLEIYDKWMDLIIQFNSVYFKTQHFANTRQYTSTECITIGYSVPSTLYPIQKKKKKIILYQITVRLNSSTLWIIGQYGYIVIYVVLWQYRTMVCNFNLAADKKSLANETHA